MDLSERPAHPFHRHPWELARFRFFRALLRDAGADRRPQAILDVGADAGLAIVRRGGLFHSLILPRYLGTLLRRRQRTAAAHSLEWRSGAATARLLEEALALEGRLSLLLSRAGLDVPGLSWWALC